MDGLPIVFPGAARLIRWGGCKPNWMRGWKENKTLKTSKTEWVYTCLCWPSGITFPSVLFFNGAICLQTSMFIIWITVSLLVVLHVCGAHWVCIHVEMCFTNQIILLVLSCLDNAKSCFAVFIIIVLFLVKNCEPVYNMEWFSISNLYYKHCYEYLSIYKNFVTSYFLMLHKWHNNQDGRSYMTAVHYV